MIQIIKSLLFLDCKTNYINAKKARLVQVVAVVKNTKHEEIERYTAIVKPEGFDISDNAIEKNGITKKRAIAEGKPLMEVLKEIARLIRMSHYLVGHNIAYDKEIIWREMITSTRDTPNTFKQEIDILRNGSAICTMLSSTGICKLPSESEWAQDWKWPKLTELYQFLFKKEMKGAHDAEVNIDSTILCFDELRVKHHLFEEYFNLPIIEVGEIVPYRYEKNQKIANYNKLTKDKKVVIHIGWNESTTQINRFWENGFGGGMSGTKYLNFWLDIDYGNYVVSKADYETILSYTIGNKMKLNQSVPVKTTIPSDEPVRVIKQISPFEVRVKKGKLEAVTSILNLY